MRLSAGVEALARLDSATRELLFGDAWPLMWGMRNRIAHGYLLAKDPGRFRTGPVSAQDESTGEVVSGGRTHRWSPAWSNSWPGRNTDRGEPMVEAAMAHLNLVMIHPFRDGNGRMAPRAGRLW